MTAENVIAELKAMGTVQTKKIFLKHGIKEPMFGVLVRDLKTIQKKVKTDHHLARALYATGNADAMYLAGLIADEKIVTKKELSDWVSHATSTSISEYTVPWLAAESKFGFELALEWIESKKEYIAAAGWATLSNLVSLKPDNELDIPALKKLMDRVVNSIHKAPNRVRNTMNGFLIAVGSYVTVLTDYAIQISKKMGDVQVDVGDTACKVPNVIDYIKKVKDRGSLGKKKKMVRC